MFYNEIVIPNKRRYNLIPKMILQQAMVSRSYDNLKIEEVKICFDEVCASMIQKIKKLDPRVVYIKILILCHETVIVIETEIEKVLDKETQEQKRSVQFSVSLIESLMNRLIFLKTKTRYRIILIKRNDSDLNENRNL